MKILFICKYNRFRSRVAEAYFKKINKNKKIEVKSAGIIRGRYPLDIVQVKVSKKLGINIEGRPKGVSTELLIWQDVIIISANDVPEEIFKENKKRGKKTIVWKIPDVFSNDEGEVKRIVKSIMRKVEALEKELRYLK